jgi:hypothetical protein
MEQRDAYITARIEDECAGCEDVLSHDRETGEPLIGFRPAEGCPVHGVDVAAFWAELNAELRQRFGVPDA